jgi:hypothetical protein
MEVYYTKSSIHNSWLQLITLLEYTSKLSSQHECVLSLQIPEHNCLVYFKTLSYLSHCRIHSNASVYCCVTMEMQHMNCCARRGNVCFYCCNNNCLIAMETPQTHSYAAGTVTLLWKCCNSLLYNRHCYVTMEMHYGA